VDLDAVVILVALLVVGSRFFVPLLIPLYPLPTMIVCLVLDAVDQTVFQTIAPTAQLDWYQGYDKALDIYYLTIAYLSTLRNWANLAAFQVSRFLLYYRLVGVVLFEISQVRTLLLIFPNTFEYFFDFYEAVRARWDPRRMSAMLVVGVAAFIWIVIKLPQEWWIHVAQLDTTDMIKEHIFHVSPDTPWSEAIQGNLGIVIAFVIIVVLLIIFAWWLVTRKLPPADRPLTLAADTRQPPLSPRAVERAAADIQRRLLARELLEKVALIGLVTSIFGLVLEARGSGIGLAIGVAVVVVANTAVSQWLARRGYTWESAIRQFLAMLAVNAVIVVVIAILLPGSGTDVDLPRLAFFLLLISVLITLYDRFRPRYIARFRDA
jgi:hypothetical protein